MIPNRSVPKATVIPVLAYPDIADVVAWLCGAFGFEERLRIGDHRAQLIVGEEAVIVTKLRAEAAPGSFATHSVLVRVEDVDAHHARAAAYGATILDPPTDYPYGERQYTVEDLGGHRWTFSQSIADADPATWGGTAIDLSS